MSIKGNAYAAGEKPFDITRHEWSDESVDLVFTNNSGDVDIEFNCDLSEFSIDKADAIAIAKHFKLTAEDLKLGNGQQM